MRLALSRSECLCIDWDERSLRILETVMQRSGPLVRRAVHVPVPDGMDVRDPSTMGDFLRQTLGKHRIRTRRAVVDVPRQDTVLNRLSLPSGTMDEMSAMVHLQIAKELPFSKDQAVIDFAVVPKPGSPICDVWVAAIRVNVVEYYRQVFSAAGLKLERMGLRPYANVRALQATGEIEGRVVMVDIGPSMTEINILLDGQLMYTRAAQVSVPVSVPTEALTGGNGDEGAPQPLAEPTPTWSIDNLLIEVSRTITAYRASDLGATIDRIVLSGTAGIDDELVRAFQERFDIRTEVYSIPPSLRWRTEITGPAAPFSAVTGLALSSVGEPLQRFDFLHVKEPEAEHRQRVRQRPILVATVALFAAAAVVAGYQPIRKRNYEIADLKATISLKNKDAKQREDALEKIDDLTSWQNGNVIWIDYLKKIAEVFPSNKDCYITQLDVNSAKGVISIELAAANRFVAAKVVDAIKAVQDKNGRPVFNAVAGNKAELSRIREYPIRDDVTVTVRSVAPKPKKSRRGR